MCFGSAPLVPRTKNVLVNNDVLKEQHPSPHRALSCFLIAPTERHGERCLSSSHPDRSLYAVLAFIRYAWCRMLCSTAVRVRAYVFFFSIFARTWSCQLLIVAHRYTYTQQQTPFPQGHVLSSVPSVALTQGHTQGSLPPERTVSALVAFMRYVCAVSSIYICVWFEFVF